MLNNPLRRRLIPWPILGGMSFPESYHLPLPCSFHPNHLHIKICLAKNLLQIGSRLSIKSPLFRSDENTGSEDVASMADPDVSQIWWQVVWGRGRLLWYC